MTVVTTPEPLMLTVWVVNVSVVAVLVATVGLPSGPHAFTVRVHTTWSPVSTTTAMSGTLSRFELTVRTGTSRSRYSIFVSFSSAFGSQVAHGVPAKVLDEGDSYGRCWVQPTPALAAIAPNTAKSIDTIRHFISTSVVRSEKPVGNHARAWANATLPGRKWNKSA